MHALFNRVLRSEYRQPSPLRHQELKGCTSREAEIISRTHINIIKKYSWDQAEAVEMARTYRLGEQIQAFLCCTEMHWDEHHSESVREEDLLERGREPGRYLKEGVKGLEWAELVCPRARWMKDGEEASWCLVFYAESNGFKKFKMNLGGFNVAFQLQWLSISTTELQNTYRHCWGINPLRCHVRWSLLPQGHSLSQ